MRHLALLLVLLAVPVSARQYAHAQVSSGDERLVWPNVRPPTPQAYCFLAYADITNQKWPEWFWPYSLLICDVTSSASDFASFHATGAGASYLASISAQSVPIYRGFDTNSFNVGLKAAWDSTHFGIYELDSSKVMRVAGFMQWCPRKASVDSLVRIMADSAYGKVAWQGIFIDECEQDFPAYKLNILGSTNFDCDGDGVADNKAKLEAQWDQWRPYLTQRLRAISADKPIIANSAGPLGDSNLNGITIENVGDGIHADSTAAIEYLTAQKAVSRSPFIGIVWSRAQNEVQSCLTVVRRIPGVYYGIHSGDGMP